MVLENGGNQVEKNRNAFNLYVQKETARKIEELMILMKYLLFLKGLSHEN